MNIFQEEKRGGITLILKEQLRDSKIQRVGVTYPGRDGSAKSLYIRPLTSRDKWQLLG
jgi:hypothetical protein